MIYELTIGGTSKKSRFKPVPVTIDWDKVPEAAREFVIKYGLRQYIADGAAGAESEADMQEGVKERVRKVLEGDFTRAKGEGLGKPDTEETRAEKLARAFIRDQLKAANATADKETIAEAAKELAKSPDSDFRKEARKQLKAEADSKAALAQAGGDVLAKLLANAATGKESE